MCVRIRTRKERRRERGGREERRGERRGEEKKRRRSFNSENDKNVAEGRLCVCVCVCVHKCRRACVHACVCCSELTLPSRNRGCGKCVDQSPSLSLSLS